MKQALGPLDAGGAGSLRSLLSAIDKAFPLSRAHALNLHKGVRDLWSALTEERGGRRVDYLNDPALRSAYLRYALPWNVYRYLRFMPALREAGILDPARGPLPPAIDLGSGPLTFPIALYLARADLRAEALVLDCLDRSAKALAEGEELLRALALALTGKELAWKVKRVKASFMEARGSYGLASSCYVANELFERDGMGAEERARLVAGKLAKLVAPGGAFLLLEPGTPPAAGLLHALRESLRAEGWRPLSPCTHSGPCPLPPRRGSPWCHFVFDAEGAPKALEDLSRKAGLPKERASLSWLAMERGGDAGKAVGPAPDAAGKGIAARIVSEPFGIPGGEGCYACCAAGRVLLRCAAGKAPPSGSVTLVGGVAAGIDAKSGLPVHIPANSSDNRY